MPSALETLVKVLKLEQDTSYQDKAVIGGLQSFADHWAADAHAQAKKPEHHVLVDELASILVSYSTLSAPTERHDAVKYMLGRITGRIPPRGEVPSSQYSSQSSRADSGADRPEPPISSAQAVEPIMPVQRKPYPAAPQTYEADELQE